MTRLISIAAIGIAALISLLTACSVAPRGPVTFNIAINQSWFSPDAPLTVQVFNQTKLPGGVEAFVFELDKTGPRLEVPTTTLHAGERFRLVVTGLAADGSHNIMGSLDWVAESEFIAVELDDMAWLGAGVTSPPSP